MESQSNKQIPEGKVPVLNKDAKITLTLSKDEIQGLHYVMMEVFKGIQDVDGFKKRMEERSKEYSEMEHSYIILSQLIMKVTEEANKQGFIEYVDGDAFNNLLK